MAVIVFVFHRIPDSPVVILNTTGRQLGKPRWYAAVVYATLDSKCLS